MTKQIPLQIMPTEIIKQAIQFWLRLKLREAQINKQDLVLNHLDINQRIQQQTGLKIILVLDTMNLRVDLMMQLDIMTCNQNQVFQDQPTNLNKKVVVDHSSPQHLDSNIKKKRRQNSLLLNLVQDTMGQLRVIQGAIIHGSREVTTCSLLNNECLKIKFIFI